MPRVAQRVSSRIRIVNPSGRAPNPCSYLALPSSLDSVSWKGIKTRQAGQGLKGRGQKRFIRGRAVSTVSQGMTGKDKWAKVRRSEK